MIERRMRSASGSDIESCRTCLFAVRDAVIPLNIIAYAQFSGALLVQIFLKA